MTEDTAIDGKVFEGLKQNVGADFIGELIDTFVNDAPQMLADMRAALRAGDAEAFRRAAHSFKSNSATFGAISLAAHAKELEMMGKAGTLDGASLKVDQLETEYRGVRDELERLRQ